MTKKLIISLFVITLLSSCGSQRVREEKITTDVAIVFLGVSSNLNDLNILKDTVAKRASFDERRINEKNAIERNTVIRKYVYFGDPIIIAENITGTKLISTAKGEVSAAYFVLMNKNGKLVKRVLAANGDVTSFFINPGEYKLIICTLELSMSNSISRTNTTSLNFNNEVIANFSVKAGDLVYLGHIDVEILKINRNIFRRVWRYDSLKIHDFDYVISVQDRREDIPENQLKFLSSENLETKLIETNKNNNGEAIPTQDKKSPATRYKHPETGRSVTVDDTTGEVFQVGGDGFDYNDYDKMRK